MIGGLPGQALPDPLATLSQVEQSLAPLTQEVATLLAAADRRTIADQLADLLVGINRFEMTYRDAMTHLDLSQSTRLMGASPMEAQKLRDAVQFGQLRLRHWPHMNRLVERQMLHDPAPLITHKSIGRVGRQDGAVNNLMRVLGVLSNPLSDKEYDEKALSYPDINLSGEYFMNLCSAAYRLAEAGDVARPRRFIDVGCGGGTKPLIASSYFEQSDGIELHEGYVAYAQAFLKTARAEGVCVMQADALMFDDYGKYDVIYFYRPMRDTDLQTQLEHRICETARPGTIVIAPLTEAMHGFAPKTCRRLIDSIFVVGVDDTSAQALLDKAELLGSDVGLHTPDQGRKMGFWGPILAQSRHNGFEMGGKV